MAKRNQALHCETCDWLNNLGHVACRKTSEWKSRNPEHDWCGEHSGADEDAEIVTDWAGVLVVIVCVVALATVLCCFFFA